MPHNHLFYSLLTIQSETVDLAVMVIRPKFHNLLRTIAPDEGFHFLALRGNLEKWAIGGDFSVLPSWEFRTSLQTAEPTL